MACPDTEAARRYIYIYIYIYILVAVEGHTARRTGTQGKKGRRKSADLKRPPRFTQRRKGGSDSYARHAGRQGREGINRVAYLIMHRTISPHTGTCMGLDWFGQPRVSQMRSEI